jgi:SNF2 family DNA or RNA helicase
VLSATSQNKKYIDLYPQYKILGSKVFNVSPKDFKKTYCIEALNYNMVYAGKSRFPFNEIVGYRHTDVMDTDILDYTYYKKYESKYDRPIEIPQHFKMTSDMKYFKENKVWPKIDEKEIEAKIKSGDETCIEDLSGYIIANRPTLHHTYMRESCSGFIKDQYLKDNPKAQWLKDFLEGNEGRVVVFTNFIAETVIINKICLELKRNCCIYDGTNKDLSEWHDYDDCVAIINVQAGSAGLNDFIKTNIAIFFSPPENYIDFTQAKGRIDRIGQTKQPVYYYLQIVGSVEPAIYKTLAEGKSFDQRLFDAWSEGG